MGFASMIVGQFAHEERASGCAPVIWIMRPNSPSRLCPHGLAVFFDPGRLVVLHPSDRKEALWCLEESLRASPGLVIADLDKAANLTESRRLQLAAEAGGSVGLSMIPDAEISNAAETRWRSTYLPCAAHGALHRWELLKNKKGILGAWEVAWNATARNLTVVSASGGGAGLAQQRDNRPLEAIRDGRDAQKRLAALLDQRGG